MLKSFFPPSPYHEGNLPRQFSGLTGLPAYSLIIRLESHQLLASDQFASFREKLLAVPGKLEHEGLRIWLREPGIHSITLRNAPKGRPLIAAVIRFFGDDDNKAAQLVQHFAFMGETSLFKVKHFCPLDYQMTWANGECSPGLVSLSCFRARPGISPAEFLQYWFYSHTPFALDIHPLWRYERNQVLQMLQGQGEGFDGIVPLHVRYDEYLKFRHFFAHDGKNAYYNAMRINNDVKAFLDLGSIETTAMREYVFS